jgi:hypothetical protein
MVWSNIALDLVCRLPLKKAAWLVNWHQHKIHETHALGGFEHYGKKFINC